MRVLSETSRGGPLLHCRSCWSRRGWQNYFESNSERGCVTRVLSSQNSLHCALAQTPESKPTRVLARNCSHGAVYDDPEPTIGFNPGKTERNGMSINLWEGAGSALSQATIFHRPTAARHRPRVFVPTSGAVSKAPIGTAWCVAAVPAWISTKPQRLFDDASWQVGQPLAQLA